MSKPKETKMTDQAAVSYARRSAAMRAAWSPEVKAFARDLEAVIMVAVRVEQAQRTFGWSYQKVAEMAGVPVEDVIRIRAHDETVSAGSQAAVLAALRLYISGV